MFAEARLQQYYINKESEHIPCNGIDMTQVLKSFPALGNVSVYHIAMQLTAPPSLGFRAGTRLIVSFGYSKWKRCPVMVTAKPLAEHVTVLAQGGLYVMIRQERYSQIEENLDIEPEQIPLARHHVDLALQQVFGIGITELHKDTCFEPERGLITADDEMIIENMDILDREGNPFFENHQSQAANNNQQQQQLPLGFQAGDASHLSINTHGQAAGPADPNVAHVQAALARQGVNDAVLQDQFNAIQAQQQGNFNAQPV
jgi:hypothetical protein